MIVDVSNLSKHAITHTFETLCSIQVYFKICFPVTRFEIWIAGP